MAVAVGCRAFCRRLNISDLQQRDEGLYVCQISTHPPKGLHTHLKVSQAVIEIQGDQEDGHDQAPDK